MILTSTYGDGEPPDNALAFHSSIHQSELSLTGLHFSVFALGDSSYPEFCKCGHDFHNRLAALGAKSLTPIVEADTDSDLPFAEWSKAVETSLPLH